MTYRTEVRNRKQYSELHEPGTGLGFRGIKKKGNIGTLSEREDVNGFEF